MACHLLCSPSYAMLHVLRSQQAGLLMTNAVAILNNERLLEKRECVRV